MGLGGLAAGTALVLVYDRLLQLGYERDSFPVILREWRERPVSARLLEGIASMAAPLL